MAGVTNVERLPDVPCGKVKIKALAGNSGNVYLGAGSDVTATTGFQLDASEETEWLEIDNLNKLYRICDGTGDRICYMVLR